MDIVLGRTDKITLGDSDIHNLNSVQIISAYVAIFNAIQTQCNCNAIVIQWNVMLQVQ